MEKLTSSKAKEWYYQANSVMPLEAWYGLGLGAAFASLSLWLAGEREWSRFVGMFAPVFLLLALFHRPPRENE
jgi:hypothetical protein